MKFIYRTMIILALSYPVAAIGIWGMLRMLPSLFQTYLAGTLLFSVIMIEGLREPNESFNQKKENKEVKHVGER